VTRRAALLLAALEAGCTSREDIFAHQGRFSLLNNGASELRAAGFPVACEFVDGDYHYILLDEPRHDDGPGNPPPYPFPGAGLVEQDTGQFALDVAA
jgi:hypothetical protein